MGGEGMTGGQQREPYIFEEHDVRVAELFDEGQFIPQPLHIVLPQLRGIDTFDGVHLPCRSLSTYENPCEVTLPQAVVGAVLVPLHTVCVGGNGGEVCVCVCVCVWYV